MPVMHYLKRLFTGIITVITLTQPVTALAESLYDKLPVTTLEGDAVDLNQYKGRLVLLNFWATWCPPCIKEMPSMQRLQDQFSEQEFQVVAVNLAQNATTVESFLMEQEFEFTLPVYLDEKGQGFKDLELQGMPSSFLIDQQGQILETIVGGREWDEPKTVEILRSLVKN
ncbi:MAG: TlpA family protein disulfide reductase [Amphritea sp.]|nr:TlpA family protein disulfide reductase [Amphritea sp.]